MQIISLCLELCNIISSGVDLLNIDMQFDDTITEEGVERGQATRRLEERAFIQTAKERKLKSMQKLARNHAPVHLKQNTRPHHPGENQTRRPG
ncbi:unnamed protein product [Trichobilharzia regenti]|nr:unnamed protein product [Trichobilharzia regenti]